jgi:hypothetical protein
MAGMKRLADARELWPVLKRRIFSRETVITYESPEVASSPQVNSSIEVRRATYSLIEDLGWFHRDWECEVFRRFLDAGHIGYLAYVNGLCVHRSWFVPGPEQVREHWSRIRLLAPDEGFVHYCKTAEEARGMGVFPAVLGQISREHGSRHTTMAVDEDNFGSRRAAAKAGWIPVAETTYTVLLGVPARRRRPVRS